MRILKKVKKRYSQFKTNPLTKDAPRSALYRYINFHLSILLFKRIKYKWIYNLKIIIKKGDAGIVGNIFYGLYEFNESAFLLHFLNENDYFVDIGANLGHYSLLASGVAKCSSMAIEPFPDTFHRLTENVKLNKLDSKIELKNIGLGEIETTLNLSCQYGSMNHIVLENDIESIKIKVSTLNKILSGKEVNLLKMDAEGYEYNILKGGTNILKNESLKAIIIEINNTSLRYNISPNNIIDLVESYGFKAYKYDPSIRKLFKLKDYNHDQFNTIFIRDLPFVINRLSSAKSIDVNGYEF